MVLERGRNWHGLSLFLKISQTQLIEGRVKNLFNEFIIYKSLFLLEFEFYV